MTANNVNAAQAGIGPAQERNEMPSFSTSSAMALLWKKSSPAMALQELEWFADGAAAQVQRDADLLAAVLMDTGCLVLSDNGGMGAFLDTASASSLIFNLQSQLSTIAGLSSIAVEASYQARIALKKPVPNPALKPCGVGVPAPGKDQL